MGKLERYIIWAILLIISISAGYILGGIDGIGFGLIIWGIFSVIIFIPTILVNW